MLNDDFNLTVLPYGIEFNLTYMNSERTQQIRAHLFVLKGDITTQKTDAIVNAANTSLLGGGGVDGAIHRAAGPLLLKECREIHGCNPGEARITKGYNLAARYVIHTPGPIYRDGTKSERDILMKSYINSLSLAYEYGLQSISFPAISTGVYGYPKQEACEVAIETTISFCESRDYILDVYFVLFDEENYQIYKKALSHKNK